MLQILKQKSFLASLIVLFVFGLDVITKNLISENPNLWRSYFGGILRILPVRNTGVAFGLFSGINAFFIFFNITLLAFLLYVKRKVKTSFSFYSIHFIIGGALGNIYDRIRFGHVIDFIDFKFFPAIFNLADFFITFGVILIILDRDRKKGDV
ncbi:MAG: signal peptidase II [Elusimicrobiales bacterium]